MFFCLFVCLPPPMYVINKPRVNFFLRLGEFLTEPPGYKQAKNPETESYFWQHYPFFFTYFFSLFYHIPLFFFFAKVCLNQTYRSNRFCKRILNVYICIFIHQLYIFSIYSIQIMSPYDDVGNFGMISKPEYLHVYYITGHYF